ncbi:multi-copper oxidase laccase-like protein [Serpula lacrymans var. lacrymans S7.3]|uniref:Multi-copper oxidase laccase-like protein n=2 Tax=Serpula lacrymans var. lacrymans TaxID=341189 RepID=F8QG75_SERL3|nr:laccase-like protein [Serpula lacrymans var. lacrymans S7.9]EGN92690.1 multi-copper oxidase laccase-like protein [Serpula lacrymans var. lacrymans S7.3]EGO19446.1 laccase-like protein [Serpula lacrymans var. lacrymans S7.9]
MSEKPFIKSNGSESASHDDAEIKAASEGAPIALGSPSKDRVRTRRRICILSIIAFFVVILALALGLGLGLGLQHHSSANYVTTNSSFLLNSSFVITSTPTTRYYEWAVGEATGSPDDFQRTMLVVNNQFPGPLIEVNSGDELVVNVFNKMSNGTTIHWHGQIQNGTNYMDGTSGITQCPIPPGMNFTYRFTIDPNQYGTFWWHAHASTQYTDGIYGPFIIHSPNEPIIDQYDREAVIVLSDWYHDMSSGLLTQYLSNAGIDGSNYGGFNPGAEPVPDSGLINGLMTGSSFIFEPNLRYRLRLINAGSLTEFVFSVDDHVLDVVEADGTSLDAVSVHRVPINVAQRYSVILTTNQTSGSYNVRGEMQSVCYKLTNPNLNTMVLGTMTYGAEPSTNVTTQDWSDAFPQDCVDLNSTMIVPALPLAAPNSTQDVLVTMSFQQTVDSGGQQTRAFINNTSWQPDSSDATVLQMSLGGATTSFDSNQLVVVSDNIGVINLVLNNQDDASHPFHLHGHVFWIVGEGAGLYEPGVSIYTSSTNPPRRDTLSVPGYSWIAIRFSTDNPGLWAFHCHIGWHMAAGLLMQFASLPSEIQKFNIPSYVGEQCKSQSGGSLVG